MKEEKGTARQETGPEPTPSRRIVAPWGRRWIWMAAMVLCLVALIALAAPWWHQPQEEPPLYPWGPSTPAPKSRAPVSITCGPVMLPDGTKRGAEPEGAELYLRPPSKVGFYTMLDEIIVTGPMDALEEVTSSVFKAFQAEFQLEFATVQACRLQIKRPGDLPFPFLPFKPEDLEELQMNLYRLTETGEPTGSTERTGAQDRLADFNLWVPRLEEALRRLNEAGARHRVYADPNYLVGLLGQSACGYPHSVVGSPHSVVGSPWELVSGSSSRDEGTSAASTRAAGPKQAGGNHAEATSLYENQWAWEHTGLGSSLQTLMTGTIPTGDSIRVGVLDTVPDPEDFSYDEAVEALGWLPEIFWLPSSEPAVDPTQIMTVPTGMGDHGLFVAGLIHEMAPESDIRLLQVLDSSGCGSLYDLNKAIAGFVTQVEHDRSALDGAVLNLSLGVQRPTDASGPDVALLRKGLMDILPEKSGGEIRATMMAQVDRYVQFLLDDTVESLQAAVSLAHAHGVVVVAAAGNGSYVGNEPLPPQLPAAYPSVIGVASSNVRRELSCFSHWGDVAAPGGDGGDNQDLKVEEPDLADLTCLPMLDYCVGDCWDAVIGPALTSPTGYVYWSGTSFSAPLVSGLAALVMDAGGTPNVWLPPRDVFQVIHCGAAPTDGVINAPATLFRCLP